MKASLLVLALTLFFVAPGHAQQLCRDAFLTEQVMPFDPDKSVGLQLMEKELDVIGNFFIANKKLSDSEKTKALMKVDLRRTFFKLQAMSRMFEAQNLKFFESERQSFKILEDVVGKLDLAASLRKHAEDIQEPQLIAYFTKQELTARATLLSTMKEVGLWNQPEQSIANLKSAFAKKGNWEIGKKEKKELIAIILDHAKTLHKDVKNEVFDKADIEKGLHELRRHLRWVLIQLNSLNGMVELRDEGVLSKNVGSWYEKALAETPELLNNKYIKTDEVRVKKPIAVPLKQLALIADLVTKIGESKDSAEMQIYFGDALKEMAATRVETDAIMKKLDQSLESEKIDHRAMAREIQKQLADTKLLKHFYENLEEMN